MINFENCQVLTYDSQNSFFGDNLFRFKTTAALTINGWVGDIYGQSGVIAAISGISGLIASSVDFQPIVLRGKDFGPGRVLNWSFEPSNDVRTTQYSCNVEIYSTGSLYNLTGAYYGNLRQTLLQPGINLQFLDSLDENYSFNQQKNGLIEANHDLNIKFISGNDGFNPIDKSKYLAKQLFSSGDLLYAPSGAVLATGLLYSLLFPTGVISVSPKFSKKYYAENYNNFTFDCSFSERYSYDPNNSNDYFYVLSHSCQTDENGLTNVTENANIRGLIIPIYNSALSGYRDLITGAYSRCNSVFNNYVGTGGYLLINEPITNGSTLNKFAGTIDYAITYTNSPNTNSGYFWNYTTEISKSDEIVTVAQNGQFIGRGKIGTTEKYQNALQAFNANFSDISLDIGAIYSGSVSPAKTLHEVGGTTEMGNYRGTIGYTLNLSDDPTLIFDGTINKKTINISNQKPQYIFSEFNIFGTNAKPGRSVLQLGSNSTLGNENIEIVYNYKRAEPPDVQILFNRFKVEVQDYMANLPGNVWCQDCQFSVNEIENTFNASASISYTQAKNPDSVNLDWS